MSSTISRHRGVRFAAGAAVAALALTAPTAVSLADDSVEGTSAEQAEESTVQEQEAEMSPDDTVDQSEVQEETPAEEAELEGADVTSEPAQEAAESDAAESTPEVTQTEPITESSDQEATKSEPAAQEGSAKEADKQQTPAPEKEQAPAPQRASEEESDEEVVLEEDDEEDIPRNVAVSSGRVGNGMVIYFYATAHDLDEWRLSITDAVTGEVLYTDLRPVQGDSITIPVPKGGQSYHYVVHHATWGDVVLAGTLPVNALPTFIPVPDAGSLEHIQKPGQGDDEVRAGSGHEGTFTVDEVTHQDGKVIVVVTAADGYEFEDGTTQTTITLDEFVESMAPQAPIFDEAGQTVTIPEDDNFDYSFSNSGETTSIGPGQHWLGPVGEGLIVATPKDGVIVEDDATTEWSFNFEQIATELTVINPDETWVKHTQNPGQGDDQFDVRDEFTDKVMIITVESSNEGGLDVVLMPKDGYTFPEAENVYKSEDGTEIMVLKFNDFIEDQTDDDTTDGDDQGSGSDDDTTDGDDQGSGSDDDTDGSDDNDDTGTDSGDTDGSDQDADDSANQGDSDDNSSKDDDANASNGDDVDDSSKGDSTSGGADTDSKTDTDRSDDTVKDKDARSDRSGDSDKPAATGKDANLNDGFGADTGVEEPFGFAPVAGLALVAAGIAGVGYSIRRRSQQ